MRYPHDLATRFLTVPGGGCASYRWYEDDDGEPMTSTVQHRYRQGWRPILWSQMMEDLIERLFEDEDPHESDPFEDEERALAWALENCR